jgi:plastocyanin
MKSLRILAAGVLTGISMAVVVACGPAAPESTAIQVAMGDDFRFDPAVITVQVGQPVELEIASTGALEHNFISDSLGVTSTNVQGGQSETLTFTPGTPGEYEFYCKIAGHREAGMVGTIVVEP